MKKTKSGQSTNELYKSSWLYFQRLQFLVPQMQPAPRRDTLELSNTFDESDAEGIDDNPENVQPKYPKKKRTAKNRFKEKRIEILNKCSNLLTHKPSSVPQQPKEVSSFALYVDDKLKTIDYKTRIIVEKKIT